MGGKTWQAEEEHFFWKVVIPRSPEGLRDYERDLSWSECAQLMTLRLGHKQFRLYNKQLLYEHFYQNCRSERPSPRARPYVKEYLAERGPVPVERPGGRRSAVAETPTSPRASYEKSSDMGIVGVDQSNSSTLIARTLAKTIDEDTLGRHFDAPGCCSQQVPHAQDTSLHSKDALRSARQLHTSQGRTPLPMSAPMESCASRKVAAGTSIAEGELPPRGFNRLPRLLPLASASRGISILNDDEPSNSATLSSVREPDSKTYCRNSTFLASSSDGNESSEGPLVKRHGSMFEALLQATSASSTEHSPFDSRSGSVSSSNTSVGEITTKDATKTACDNSS